VWTYSGVRPLFDDGVKDAKAASREYVLELDDKPGAAPLLSVIGGKITVYRRLAEEVLERLGRHLPPAKRHGAGWTGKAPLPGGDFAIGEVSAQAARLKESLAFLSDDEALRLVQAYGTRARRALGDARSADALGRQFGAGLSEAEVCYLMDNEWAQSAEDVLWRRSKLGLRFGAAQAAELEAWMRARLAAPLARRA
jgi:glycerol-3-phosphate dehydrogenase